MAARFVLWAVRQRSPARITAVLEVPKDLKQGIALLDAVRLTMPQYPTDADFRASLPEKLVEPFEQRAAQQPTAAASSW